MRVTRLPIAMALALSLCAANAQANAIVFDLNYAYTSATLPTSTPPWATFTFRDTTDCSPGPCDADMVQLLIASSLETGSEFITQTNFNSLVALSPAAVVYTSGSGSFQLPTIGQYSANGYNAGGGQDFDLEISFETSGRDGGALRFNSFDTALFTIISAGITASTFNVATADTPALWASAHVQGISATGACGGSSAWVGDRNGTTSGGGSATCGTPVPDSASTLALLGFAMAGVGYLRRRHI